MLKSILLSGIVLCTSAVACAEPTEIAVRVLAEEAKFIGTSMGGAKVTLTNVETGEVVAEGITKGSTGDTELIMTDGLNRYETRWGKGAAEFRTVIDIDRPVKLRAEVTGPLGFEQAKASASSEQWVVPGKHVTRGDAWQLELPGFVIGMKQAGQGRLEADIVMMCGCPITPGGLWDADEYEVAALIYQSGEKVTEIPMRYGGTPNRFVGDLSVLPAGEYGAKVYAYDPRNGNTGLAAYPLVIE